MLGLFRKRQTHDGLTGVGIDAAGCSVVRVRRSDSAQPVVTACEYRPWNEGERDKDLARLADDYHLKQCDCITSLDVSDYNLLLTEAPDVSAAEMRAAIRWRIKDLVDFPIEQATIDVFTVPGGEQPGRQRSVYAVAARSEAIQRRITLFKDCGIGLDIIDIPELAQRNIAALLPQDERGVAMLSLSANSGLITITRQGEIYLSRTLDIGLDDFADVSAHQDLFDRVVLEVQRSLDYYDSYFRMAPIRELVFAPLGKPINGLIEHLAANLGVTPSAIDLSQLLEFEVSVAPEVLHRCFWTLATALRSEERQS